MLVYRGRLSKESLLDEAFLLFVTNIKEENGVITYMVGDDMMPAVAEEISKALKPRGWFGEIEDEYVKLVIFPNKIFKFSPKDATAKQKVIEYGKSLGVPEVQLAKL